MGTALGLGRIAPLRAHARPLVASEPGRWGPRLGPSWRVRRHNRRTFKDGRARASAGISLRHSSARSLALKRLCSTIEALQGLLMRPPAQHLLYRRADQMGLGRQTRPSVALIDAACAAEARGRFRVATTWVSQGCKGQPGSALPRKLRPRSDGDGVESTSAIAIMRGVGPTQDSVDEAMLAWADRRSASPISCMLHSVRAQASCPVSAVEPTSRIARPGSGWLHVPLGPRCSILSWMMV